jgi:hypothetical protein
MTRKPFLILASAVVWLGAAGEAAAQLDPLLFIKRVPPNVLVAVETSNRMQRDPDNAFRDAFVYAKTGAIWEPSIGIPFLSGASRYRRKYINLVNTDPAASGGDKFGADRIETVTDLDPAFATFDERTRLAVARRSLIEAINGNTSVARFGLIRMRQSNPAWAGVGAIPEKNEGPVVVSDPGQQANTESSGKWKITRNVVGAVNGSIAGPVAPLTAPDAANANTAILATLGLGSGAAGALIPAGRDAANIVDAPIDNMLDDLKAEAVRLANADTVCRNTVAILVVGGTEGNTTGEDPAAKATQFLNIGANHRVPVHVIAITPIGDTTQLRRIAENSGGVYTEITAAMINATVAGQPVPEFVRAVNFAVQHAFTEQTHLDTDPDAVNGLPIGPYSEHQVTSPIIGTVNLENAKDINGDALTLSVINDPKTSVKIPQRSNVMLTTGFSLPGFAGKLRAFRVYQPVADASKPSGYKFSAAGTRLWVATVPEAARRNIFTSLPDGTVVPFTAANAAMLAPYLRDTNPGQLIDYIRQQPLGAVVGSTPALMDAPSLDPPPDAIYPAFADENKNRRSIVWVGANDGMLHAIDARLGVEVWAFVPFNLLPKLKTLRYGQPVGAFRYFVDSSPKVADVRIGDEWRTYLVMGEGAGGTFYQTFDVTLDNLGDMVAPTDDNVDNVLAYFGDATRVPLKWSFPRYSDFDVTLAPWGDIAASAPAVAKTVGQTWSDPAVGQIGGPSGKFAVLTGSGPFPYTVQQLANRGGAVAGTTFYMLNVETGAVFDSRSVGSDGHAETVDSCQAINDCRRLKNAIQADPVATGPADSRFVTKVYVGDLDGKLWRFDIGVDSAQIPKVNGLVQLYNASTQDPLTGDPNNSSQPLFASMAAVNVGGTKQYLFQATGSDLLPHNGVSQQYRLLVILDNGAAGSRTAVIPLEKVDGLANDEKVTSFPAVAGDIVFFTTTTFKPAAPCTLPDANLYAFTFIGGAAYDTNNSGSITSADKQKVTTVTGARATAPFIVDQHLAFSAGGKIQMFGDPNDFNNGVGQVGVRILSWREVR